MPSSPQNGCPCDPPTGQYSQFASEAFAFQGLCFHQIYLASGELRYLKTCFSTEYHQLQTPLSHRALTPIACRSNQVCLKLPSTIRSIGGRKEELFCLPSGKHLRIPESYSTWPWLSVASDAPYPSSPHPRLILTYSSAIRTHLFSARSLLVPPSISDLELRWKFS